MSSVRSARDSMRRSPGPSIFFRCTHGDPDDRYRELRGPDGIEQRVCDARREVLEAEYFEERFAPEFGAVRDEERLARDGPHLALELDLVTRSGIYAVIHDRACAEDGDIDPQVLHLLEGRGTPHPEAGRQQFPADEYEIDRPFGRDFQTDAQIVGDDGQSRMT